MTADVSGWNSLRKKKKNRKQILSKICVLIFFVRDRDKKRIRMKVGMVHDETWFPTQLTSSAKKKRGGIKSRVQSLKR